jgi:Zinc knuckle
MMEHKEEKYFPRSAESKAAVSCGKPGHYSKNCPERKPSPMGRQQKLFVGHVGEDFVYRNKNQLTNQQRLAPQHLLE